MASFITTSSTRQSDETMDDDDDKDDTKRRKSRNLSEKKRRDQFSMLINELGSMVTTNTRKMDKSTVLKSTMLFLKNHNEVAVRSRAHEIQEDWKPSFLSNEEFTHLILEALDGFIMVFASNGRIYYASESVTSLLGYLPSELANSTIYEITYQEDQSLLYNVLLNPVNNQDLSAKDNNQVSFTCHIKRGSLDFREEATYERVDFAGYFRSDTDIESLIHSSRYGNISSNDTKVIFVGTGRLHTPQLIQDMSLVDGSRSEFTSKHSLEWKFLFLDHRAPPIIGYLPFEVLGTSGYDYYHIDDLDKVVTCHESLMQKGEGTSCHYRFLTKGQQWIWLQTRFYIDYNQWNSKPEFIVCTHNVVSYTEVMKQLKEVKEDLQTSHKPKPNVSSGNSSKTLPQPLEGPRHRKQLDVELICSKLSNYAEPPAFPPEPILTVVTTASFLAPTASTTTSVALANTMLVNQTNIVMTTQNQMQDELQRKHEELQQLIVHQQEELRRVSEQLLIAKYGILSPLINVTVPYDSNASQQAVRCDGRPNADDGHAQPAENSAGMNILSLPVSLPVPIVPVETFSNSSAAVSPHTQPAAACAGPQVNPTLSFMTQLQLPHHLLQRHDPQLEQIQPQPPVLQDDHMMAFDICQQPEMMYSNLGASVNGQHRPARNQ